MPLLDHLDFPRVETAILYDSSAPERARLLAHEYEDARGMVLAAANKWLQSDLDTLVPETIGIEEDFMFHFSGVPVRGILDLRGEYARGEGRGKIVVADWKTSSGELDLAWQEKLISSHQWRLYSVVPPGADFISYRGVNPKGKTREVYLRVPQGPELYQYVHNYFTGVNAMAAGLREFDLWPQRKPSACGQFGQTCPFKSDCDSGREPKYLLDPASITWSYSGADRFLTCPEKFRRMKKSEVDDSTANTRIGTAVHAGLEELYRQAFVLKTEGKI